MVKSFDLGLAGAGIDKEDEQGRTVDLRALPHIFGNHLSKNGVAPRTAQAAMRHPSLDLTMNVYTDPCLLATSPEIPPSAKNRRCDCQ